MAADSKRPKKLPHWQQIALDRFYEVKKHPDFEADCRIILKRHLETLGIAEGYEALHALLDKYDLHPWSAEMVRHYALTGKTEPKTITYPVVLVSEKTQKVFPSGVGYAGYREVHNLTGRKRVYLELQPWTQRRDIDDFLNAYYKDRIEPELAELDPERKASTKGKTYVTRDHKVVRAYKEYKLYSKSPPGGVYAAIARDTGYDPDVIKKAVANYRKREKLWSKYFGQNPYSNN